MGIMERFINYLKIQEMSADDEDDHNYEGGRYWPRFLSLMPGGPSGAQTGPLPCEDDDQLEEVEITAEVTVQEVEEDAYDEEGDKEREQPSFISRKLNCMYHSAKHGLKEGALSGVFFGGGWGIYKYLDAVYLNKENKEGENDSGENGSTVNDNVIFVTAANSAIAMGVFCTFFCCTKAAIYCY